MNNTMQFLIVEAWKSNHLKNILKDGYYQLSQTLEQIPLTFYIMSMGM